MKFNLLQFLGTERSGIQCFQVLLQLTNGASTDDDTGDVFVLQDPAQGHFGQGLSTAKGDVVQRMDLLESRFGECFLLEVSAMGDSGIVRDTVQVSVGEQSLCQWGEDNESGSVFLGLLEYACFFRFAVNQVVAALLNEARYIVGSQIVVCHLGGFFRPTGDAYVECFSLAYDVDQCLESFFQRCFRVVTMAIEQVHILKVHSLQALIQTSHLGFRGSLIAVRTRPHVIACLGGDEQFITVGHEGFLHEESEGFFG